jgi:phosphatidylglycerophosphate synthase
VASLTLLDRLVVAVHRAGAGPITVVAPGTPAQLERSTALGIPIQVIPSAPPSNGAMLVASSDLMVQSVDVEAVLKSGGRLAAGSELLPIGVLLAGQAVSPSALAGLQPIQRRGVAFHVRDADAARRAERALWHALGGSSDGLVDTWFNRPLGRWLSKLLVRTSISPNAVTMVHLAIGLAGAWFFAIGTYSSMLLGAVLFQLSSIVDCVDGDIARVLFKESSFGKWLDLAGDQVVHVAVFAAIAIGLMRGGAAPYAGWLGLAAVIGAALSFAVVVRSMRHPSSYPDGRLSKLIQSATNRDFSVLILILAALGRIEWFLWMTAIGSHVFWVTALTLQLSARPERAPAR